MKRSPAILIPFLLLACGDGKDPIEPPERTVAAVAIQPAAPQVADGGTVQLSARLSDQDGGSFDSPPAGVTVTWSSSDDDIAAVSATGLVTANRPGEAQITASAAGKSGTTTVTVTQVAESIIAVSGSAQQGVSGTTLPDPLVARVVDRHGDPVPGVQVTWAVTAGGGEVEPATGTTDADGLASTVWTLGSEPGEQSVSAAAAGVTGGSADFIAQSENQAPNAAILAPANGSSFTEGDDITFEGSATDPEDGLLEGAALVWTRDDEQLGIGTSFTTDALAAGPHTVTLTATDSHGATHTVHVDITVESAIACSDVVTLGNGASMQGDLPSVVVNGTVTVAGTTNVCGSLIVTGDGALDLGANTVAVSDSFRVENRGSFTMQDDAAILRVGGNVYIGGRNTNGLLTAGRIEIAGDLRVQRGSSGCCNTYHRSLDASGTHTIVLNGTAPQSVSFSHAGLVGDSMRANHIRIENPTTITFGLAAVRGTLDVVSGATLQGAGPVMVGGSLATSGGSTFDVSRVVLRGTTAIAGAFSPDTTWLTGTDQQIAGGVDYGMVIVRGTAVLAGDAQASSGIAVTGSTAVLDIGAHELGVGGDFRIETASEFRMTDAAGYLRIAGDAYFGGRNSESITAGTLEVAGDFTQQRGSSGCCNQYPRSFRASGSHTVVLNGTGPQHVTFNTPGFGADESRMNNLRIENGSTVTFGPSAVIGTLDVAAPVTLGGTGRLLVRGALTTVAGSSIDIDWIQLGGSMDVDGSFAPDTAWFDGADQIIQGGLAYNRIVVSGEVELGGDVQAAENVRVTGTDGILSVRNNTLEVAGELRTERTGRFTMFDTASVARVHDAWFGGGNSLLSDGVMYVTGDFTQRQGSQGCCNTFDRTFRASFEHTVVLDGTTLQTVDFERGSLTSEWSRFSRLRITNPAGAIIAGQVAVDSHLDLSAPLTVPAGTSLDIRHILYLRPTAVLNNLGDMSVGSCVVEPGSSVTGTDPCGG